MKILVCRHAPGEGMGCFEMFFQQAGIAYEYQDLYIDPKPRRLEEYRGLIILGGPMNVAQTGEYPFLKQDYAYIEKGLTLDLPMLGFCLGGQLIAKVLGANIVRNSQPELGWYELELDNVKMDLSGFLQDFPARFRVFQWHEDTFEIPAGAIRLANGPSCRNQAFSWGKNVCGLQFHPEVTATMITEWLMNDESAVGEWGFQPRVIMEETRQYCDEVLRLSAILFENYRAKL